MTEAADSRPAGPSAEQDADWAGERVETSRLLLRPWHLADAPDLYAACRDLQSPYWPPTPCPSTLAEAESWATHGGHRHRRDRTGLECAVLEKATDRFVGSCDLRHHPIRPASAEVVYWVAPSARGRGYAAEAVDGLCRWAYRHGVSRVEMLVAERNIAAQRTAMRAGFAREGQIRAGLSIHDKRIDAVLFARLVTDPGTPLARALPDMDEVSDGVVTIRPLHEHDVDALLDERSDPETLRWSISPRPWGRDDAERLVASAASAWLAGSEARVAIVEAETGAYVGSIGLRMTLPALSVAELGYGMRARWRGRGYMARALRLVVGWAFDHAGVARLELGTAVGNVASQRTAERAGFTREAILRLRLPTADGGRVDEVRYGMTRPGS